jgi:hypothetical protein
MILNNGMALFTGKGLFHAQRSQGNALIQFDMVSDDTSLADNNTSTMVYVQIMPDVRSWMPDFVAQADSILCK